MIWQEKVLESLKVDPFKNFLAAQLRQFPDERPPARVSRRRMR
jgi:hypothetical protein